MFKINEPTAFLKKNTFTFDAYCPQPKYDYLSITTTLTYEQVLILFGSLSLTENSLSLLSYAAAKTLYGDKDPVLFIREFDTTQMILALVNNGYFSLCNKPGKSSVKLTDKGFHILVDNARPAIIDFFQQQRDEARLVVSEAIRLKEKR